MSRPASSTDMAASAAKRTRAEPAPDADRLAVYVLGEDSDAHVVVVLYADLPVELAADLRAMVRGAGSSRCSVAVGDDANRPVRRVLVATGVFKLSDCEDDPDYADLEKEPSVEPLLSAGWANRTPQPLGVAAADQLTVYAYC